MKQKQNNFKIISSIINGVRFAFAVSIIVILSMQTCPAVDVTPDRMPGIEIIFDEPKAAKTYYTANRRITFTAPANTSVTTVTKPVASGAIISSPLIVNITCPDYTLNPTETSDDSLRCDVVFKVPNTIDPGGEDIYKKEYTGTITAGSKQIPVTLTIKWLPPQITIISPPSFEKLKSGETKSGKITIMELRGYKAAHQVNFEVNKKEFNASGVNVSIPESEAYIPKLDAGGTKDISLNLAVPQRGLVPGNYSGTITVKYKEEYLDDAYPIPPPIFKFEIPYPELGLENNTFTFPDLDIPYSGSEEFTINEVAGFTPIEGIKFNITGAYRSYEDEGINDEPSPDGISWVTFDAVDFVPPGGSKKVKVRVNVPKSAAIGQYRWEGKITTAYAGSSEIFIGGTAALPGCPEMKQKFVSMASLSLVEKNSNADGLRKGTLTLLEESECIRGLNEILTVAAAAETLIAAMDDVNSFYDKNEFSEAYKRLVSSRTEVDTLIGITTTYPEYTENIDNIKNSAGELWKTYSGLIIEKFEKEAEENRYTDPGLCRDNYDKISILYGKMGDTQKALLYSDLATECKSGYTGAEEKAKEAEAEADRLYGEANTKIFAISDYRVVILLYDYPSVNAQYNESIAKYNEALDLWGVVNKPRDAARVREQIEKLDYEKEMLRKAAVIYAAVIALIILFSFIHFSRASNAYNRDTLEANLGNVVTGQKV